MTGCCCYEIDKCLNNFVEWPALQNRQMPWLAAQMLPGRTENSVKNRWNSACRKKWQDKRTKTPAGAGLGDGVAKEAKFFFPANTILPAKGHLVVWCDDRKELPGLHTGFALDADGQNIALWWPSDEGLVIQDAVGFGPQAADLSIGRAPSHLAPTQRASLQRPGKSKEWIISEKK